MDNISRASYIVGSISATVPATTELEGWVSAVGSPASAAVSYTIKLLKRKDDIIDARDRQIRELTMQLISNCKNCDSPKRPTKPSLTTKTSLTVKFFLQVQLPRTPRQFYKNNL